MVGKRYRIIETLGKGAFGTVYRAEVLGAGDFKKQVALKVLDYAGEAPDEIALRFRDEARILGLIRHRAIVGVDSLAELETGWAVVMEYVHGVNVTAVVKYGLPATRVVVSIVEEVAGALHAAWTTVSDVTNEPLKLVHRDIKPANIRLTAQGEVKVLDFGVARAEFESREANTQAMRFGSLRYMAPESFDGIEGHATDVFALGIVFGELLAGKRLEEPPKNPERYAAFVEAVCAGASSRLQPTTDPAHMKRVLALLSEMISFEPEDRPSARTVERTCRDLAGTLTGPTLRDWSEDYIPALAEKLARRKAQKSAGESPSSEILVERTGSAPRLENSLPPQSDLPVVDGTDTRASTGVAAASGAVFGAGIVMVALCFGGVAIVGGAGYLTNGFSFGGEVVDVDPDGGEPGDDGDGVADGDGDADGPDDGGADAQGDGTADAPEPLPDTEYVEIVDPDDPTRTIVIARSKLKAVEGTADSFELIDPDDPARTIVIARRDIKAGTADAAPAPAPTVAVIQQPSPGPAPAPSPSPGPAPQPMGATSGGQISVTGDAVKVSFVSGDGTFSAGAVPVATYRIMASFPNRDPIQAGTVSVREGEAVRVDCQSLMLRCSRK